MVLYRQPMACTPWRWVVKRYCCTSLEYQNSVKWLAPAHLTPCLSDQRLALFQVLCGDQARECTAVNLCASLGVDALVRLSLIYTTTQ
jgi:hypothetical protein